MPSYEEIERAYTRSRPPPDPALDGYKRFLTGSTTVIASLIAVVSLCLVFCAAADKIFGFGWGYHRRDLWYALERPHRSTAAPAPGQGS
jgi:hypothetical protein